MTLSDERKAEILDTVSKLRVTDIRDGLDWVGLHHTGTVSPEIRPLWRTKAAGFAVTARHIPTQQTVPTMSPDEYTTWAYEYWYGQVFKNDMPDQLDEHSFLVVDTCNTPTPAVGSMDSMIWAALGARGVVFHCRDSGDAHPVTSWRDLLRCEHRVATDVHDVGVAVPERGNRPPLVRRALDRLVNVFDRQVEGASNRHVEAVWRLRAELTRRIHRERPEPAPVGLDRVHVARRRWNPSTGLAGDRVLGVAPRLREQVLGSPLEDVLRNAVTVGDRAVEDGTANAKAP
jgi:hypothetical protein